MLVPDTAAACLQDEMLAFLLSVCTAEMPIRQSLDISCGLLSLMNACLAQRQVCLYFFLVPFPHITHFFKLAATSSARHVPNWDKILPYIASLLTDTSINTLTRPGTDVSPSRMQMPNPSSTTQQLQPAQVGRLRCFK